MQIAQNVHYGVAGGD